MREYASSCVQHCQNRLLLGTVLCHTRALGLVGLWMWVAPTLVLELCEDVLKNCRQCQA